MPAIIIFLETREKQTLSMCVHMDKVNPKFHGNTKGCQECEKIGTSW